jgi:hypothetical protein
MVIAHVEAHRLPSSSEPKKDEISCQMEETVNTYAEMDRLE